MENEESYRLDDDYIILNVEYDDGTPHEGILIAQALDGSIEEAKEVVRLANEYSKLKSLISRVLIAVDTFGAIDDELLGELKEVQDGN